MTTIPTHCLASGAIAIGATITAAQLHSNSNVPKLCIASAIAGSATVATLLAHHGSATKMPPLYCVAGTAAGLAGVGYALRQHAELSKVCLSYLRIMLRSYVLRAPSHAERDW